MAPCPPPSISPARGAAPAPAELAAPPWQILQRSLAATAVADLEGRLIYVNPAWLALWGHETAEGVLGMAATDASLWVDGHAAQRAQQALQSQQRWEGALVARRTDGTAVPLWCAAHLVVGGDGAPLAMMATFLDRREEVAAREALHAERQFSESVIAAAGVLVAVLDEQGRFVRFNAECERASGWQSGEVLGRTPWTTVLPAEEADTVRREAWDVAMFRTPEGQVIPYVNAWLHRDGSRRMIAWTNRVIRDAGGRRFLVSVGVDISEREATRQRLERSESRLRKAQRVARVGSWHLDLRSGTLEWSEEVFRIFELDPAQFVPSYEAFLSLVHPDDRERVDNAYQSSLRNRHPYRIEHRLRMPDGRIKWVEEQGDSEFDAAGSPLRSDGTVQDISERRQAAEALARSEAQLRVILDAYPGWIAAADDDMRYVYVNETLAAQVGKRPQDIIGRTVAEIRGPHIEAELRGLNERLLRGERLDVERTYTHADGRQRQHWVHYRVTPDVTAPDRHVFYAFGIDVTEYRLSELRLESIAEAVGIGTWQWDAAAAKLTVDDRCLALGGYVRADVEGDLLYWLLARIHPEDRDARRANYDALLGGHTSAVDSEYRFRHRDGHWVWLLDRGRVATRGADGTPVLVIGATQDIGVLKRHQEALAALNAELEQRVAQRTQALAQAKDEAERANAAKTEFLSRMSHELRTPLNAILGFGQLLELSVLGDEDAGHVGEILRAGEHLLELINEMLDLATIEAGRIRLQPQAVDLRTLVEECLHLVAPAATRAQLTLANEVAASCTHAWADRGRLRQVLLNLLSNAVKYNRRGGRVSVGCLCGARMFELRVSDTGAGLTPAQAERLFEPFERLDADRKGIQGTGIGLAVSRRLVELMHGEIGVHSRPGAGSTFWVRLPTAPAAEAPAAADDPAAGEAAAATPRAATLLYVEDNAANRRLMQRLLQRQPGLRLRLAVDADEALAEAAREPPDAVLLDIQLPGTDGYALLAWLREAGCQAPAVAVSAYAMPADVQRARAAGFVDYLTKPLDVQRTLQVIAALVGTADGG
ncbi:PAS domain S-box protein [Azohydromonas sediminis]|uniref:hybrid sensor histidine kinase/response regulator n=1 Tax=Azohydromonas sediminis TaxID=2259674 RepID=UPI000E6487CF|nr:PAS domain S-box protein [Azohydromonas sediminis]